MKNELLFEIKNLGPINKADLNIKKINVVVGENSTGKSASSKFMFCLLTALSKEGIYLANIDIKNRLNQLLYLLKINYFDGDSFEGTDLHPIEELLDKPSSNELFDEIWHKFYELSEKIVSSSLKDMYLKHLRKIQELIKINKNRDSQCVKIFNTLLDSEFPYSLKNDTLALFKGNIDEKYVFQEILIKGKPVSGKIDRNLYNCLNFENIVYVDSLSVLEFDYERSHQNNDNYPYHIIQLSRKLKNTSNKGVYDGEFYKSLNNFKRKIDDMIGGNFSYDGEIKRFFFEKDDEKYPMENTSSGLKQLGIIQLLLKNRELTENSFLILDEPEVHLHPDFQVKLAELLILLAKNLKITLYINTHSPFMAEAIEVYSKFYEFYDECNFYLTEESDNKSKYDYKLMDDVDMMDVYNTLGNPFDTINEIRFKTELRNN